MAKRVFSCSFLLKMMSISVVSARSLYRTAIPRSLFVPTTAFLLYSLASLGGNLGLNLGSKLAAQQQNADEVPGVGVDRSDEFGNDTNYGLSPPPPKESFDRQTTPLNYPNPDQVNRNSVSSSLIGLSQGFLFLEWEHLVGRVFGFVLGVSLYASEISQTRRLFQPAGLDGNSFTNIGGALGFSFYVSQQYVKGLVVQIKFGGGLLTGTYTEAGQTNAIDMFDFYFSALGVIAYRINITRNIALSPILVINGNIVVVAGDYHNAQTVPSYYRINGQSDLISLSAPADLSSGANTLLLFMHVGFGVDLTFTF